MIARGSMLPRIDDVAVLGGYRLRLWFDDGAVGDVDLAHLVGSGPVFEPFSNPEYFATVSVEPAFGTICWPNDVDLDPDVLYQTATPVQPAPPRPARASSDSSAPEEADSLPEVSRFFGIIIRMFFEDHAQPHFHVVYGGREVRVAIETLAVLDGKIQPRALALAIEWAVSHQAELRSNWERARHQEPLQKIAPLE